MKLFIIGTLEFIGFSLFGLFWLVVLYMFLAAFS
jgi:hypothetical protein